MNLIKQLYKGESLSFSLVFPNEYDMARIESHSIWIGDQKFVGVPNGQAIELFLKSSETKNIAGVQKLFLWLDDSTFGVKKYDLGSLDFVQTKATDSNDSINNGFDVLVTLTITETSITVDNVLYNYLKGADGNGIESIALISTVGLVKTYRITYTDATTFDYEVKDGDKGDKGDKGDDGSDAKVTQDLIGELIETTELETVTDNTKIAVSDSEFLKYVKGLTIYTYIKSKLDLIFENSANKQNSLAVDGTGTKYPTVDAVNSIISEVASNLLANTETTILGSSFNPALTKRPVDIQVFCNGILKTVSSRFYKNGSYYDLKLTSTVDLYGAEIVVLTTTASQLESWTLNPFFALPSRGIDFIVGVENTIYGDSLIALPTPIPAAFTVEYTCAIGNQSGNNYVINPVSGNIGTHVITAVFKYNGSTITSKTINVNVIAQKNISFSILTIGDSLVYLGHADIANGLNAALPASKTFIGSQGTLIKHDGVSGKSYETILTSSPFYISGALNIAAYFANNSLAIPDYVHIRFGANDVNLPISFAMTESYMTNYIINKSKTFIDAFLAYNPDLKIIIGLPTIGENSGAGWDANYDEVLYPQNIYIQNIHRMWMALVATYDNYAYSNRVILSNETVFLDRNDGYPKANGIHNNGVHPSQSGYIQIGKGIANTLNRELSLIPSGLTLSLISGGVKIDWTDNSSGTFQTEIWGKNDSDAYALLYTIAAGIVTKSETIDAVDLRYYKIRGKNGAYLTQFTPEQSIAMLGANVIINGDFSLWSGDNPDNWLVSNESGVQYVTENSGSCRIVTTDSSPAITITQVNKLETGAKYRFKINILSKSGVSDLRVRYDSLKYQRFAAIGQKTWYDTTDYTSISISRWSGAMDCTFDNLVVQKVLMP